MITHPSANIATSYLTHHGLWVRPGFLEPDLCRQLRSEMNSSRESRGGRVVHRDGSQSVDVAVRQVNNRTVSLASQALVARHLEAVKPELEQQFQVSITSFETPKYLMYEAGGFYRPHKDTSSATTAPEGIQQRTVSLVLFLNNEQIPFQEGTYTGGALAFFGLGNDPRTKKMGFPLHGREGLLVAFPPDLRHEVTKVTGGERYTIVSWAL